jgi:hypothetical protein
MGSSDELLNNGDAMLDIVSKIKDNKEAFAFYKEAQPHLMALEVSSYEASESIASLTHIEDEAYEDGTEDVEIYELKKSLVAVIEGNNDIRRRFGLKFKSLASDLFDTPTTVGDIDYPFDEIAAAEKILTFKQYYEQFCLYRYEFGKRAADIEPFLLFTYKDEHETHRAYHAVNESMNTEEPITFTFKLHKYRPYELSLRDLDAFRNNVKACMDVFYHMYKCIDGNDLLNPDVVRDTTGRIKEKVNPSNLFKQWERYLLAYDLRKPRDITLDKIAEKTGRRTGSGGNDPSSANKDVREAEKLIASASKGTFPN